jgi:hypothetical protein
VVWGQLAVLDHEPAAGTTLLDVGVGSVGPAQLDDVVSGLGLIAREYPARCNGWPDLGEVVTDLVRRDRQGLDLTIDDLVVITHAALLHPVGLDICVDIGTQDLVPGLRGVSAEALCRGSRGLDRRPDLGVVVAVLGAQVLRDVFGVQRPIGADLTVADAVVVLLTGLLDVVEGVPVRRRVGEDLVPLLGDVSVEGREALTGGRVNRLAVAVVDQMPGRPARLLGDARQLVLHVRVSDGGRLVRSVLRCHPSPARLVLDVEPRVRVARIAVQRHDLLVRLRGPVPVAVREGRDDGSRLDVTLRLGVQQLVFGRLAALSGQLHLHDVVGLHRVRGLVHGAVRAHRVPARTGLLLEVDVLVAVGQRDLQDRLALAGHERLEVLRQPVQRLGAFLTGRDVGPGEVGVRARLGRVLQVLRGPLLVLQVAVVDLLPVAIRLLQQHGLAGSGGLRSHPVGVAGLRLPAVLVECLGQHGGRRRTLVVGDAGLLLRLGEGVVEDRQLGGAADVQGGGVVGAGGQHRLPVLEHDRVDL